MLPDRARPCGRAKDCVQEVWLECFAISADSGQRSFAAWLNAVAANTAIDHYRRLKRRGSPVDIDEPRVEALAADEPAGEQQLDDRVIRQRIQEALEQISVNQRTAFVLRYYEDTPLPQIARILGCREGTVRRTSAGACWPCGQAKLMAKLNQ